MARIERILVTPRWGGTTDDDWYPWIAGELGEPPIARVPLPEADAPTIAGCVDAFGAALDAGDPEATLCVGHSVSVQGWLRAFEARPERRVGGLLAVAAWWSVDDPWPTIRPWIETPHDLDAILRACPRARALISTNDPFTSDHEANAALWRERLGAEVAIVEGAKHFNASREPRVLEEVRAMMG